jgi:hypothetical protein
MFKDFFYESRAVYEVMWNNGVETDGATDDSIIPRMRFACQITKATDTHTEYTIVISFPLQQWLHDRATASRCSTLPAFYFPVPQAVLLSS